MPFYLAIIYFIASRIKNKHVDDPVYRRYFIRGLNYKMFGAIGFAFIYILYYRGGDSINFFLTIKPLYNLAFRYPDIYASFMASPTSPYPMECFYQADALGVAYLLRGTATLTTIRIGSLINLFCFDSYLACTLVFAFFTYLFTWKTFRLFVSIYPKLEKEFAIAFLMIPSVLFWGSGVGKDSIMFSAIMYFFYCFYQMVIRKRNMMYNFFALILCGFIISLIRGFILFTLAPSLMLMSAIYYRNVFRSPLIRFIALPLFLGLGGAASFLFIRSIGHTVESYSLESLQHTAQGFQSWHSSLSDTQGGNSAYSLGNDLDYSPASIIRKAPLAMMIALFGPFVWQIKNVVMLMSGMESLILTYFTFKIFFNVRAYRAIGSLSRDHVVVFCIPFIFIIATAIGLTSFNYGALVRYRIPILPFFVVLLSVARYRIKTG